MTKQLERIKDLPVDIRSVALMVDSMFDEIYLVGGAVRDSLLGRETTDLDFSTPSNVDEIHSKLKRSGLFRLHTEGKEYGTIAAVIGDFQLQITSYRNEEYVQGSRRPQITASRDIDSDLSRRDFTVNSIALSRNESVDPYGGRHDIKKKIIRAVGDADIKFKEDPLRILRAFRFVSVLGFQIEENTLSKATINKNNLHIVSSERIGEELKKLLAGKYWADALNELAEEGIINVLFGVFGITYKVSSSDIHHEFEKYSTKNLEEMDIPHRWLYLIRALEFAENAAGITSTDLQATAELIMTKAQASKDVKTQLVDLINEETNSKDATDQLGSLKRQAELLKKKNNPRYMIEEAKYYSLSGRNALHEGSYNLACKELKKSIEITEDNYVFILGFTDAQKKNASLRGINTYYLARIKYFVSGVILDEKLYSKYESTDEITRYIHKHYKFKYVGKSDLDRAIDQAITFVYRQTVRDMKLEPYDDFLNKKNSALLPNEKRRYFTMYIETKIRSHSTTVKEKSRLYLKKARLAAKGKDESEYGLEYYDPYIDYLYNLMLSQASLEEFTKVYDEFVLVIENYVALTIKERKAWAGNRKKYLTSASSLVYALSLADNLDKKLKISRKIVDDYKNAGHTLNRNRYEVYLEWFVFIQELMNTEYSIKEVSRLNSMISSSKSIKYVDDDETYLASNKQDIVRIRSLIQDTAKLFIVLNGETKSEDGAFIDRTIGAISVLTSNELLITKEAFTLYKNFISASENVNISAERIEISDSELRKKAINEIDSVLTGESETIEYKSSWGFDVDHYNASSHKTKNNKEELKKAVVKDIVGFLNKQGGTVLIGVTDSIEVIGLEATDFHMQSSKDPRKKLDNIQLDMRTYIMNKITKQTLSLLSIEAFKYDDKTVLRIKVPASQKPIFYHEADNDIFYVRSGTSTDNAGVHAALAKNAEFEKSLR